MTDGSSEAKVPDLTELAAKAEGHFRSHPLFPRDDGQPEDRDIRYVCFQRRRPGDSPKYAPDEFEADQVTNWSQVYRWWGGGSYKAVAKDKDHHFLCFHPSDGWVEMEGESKPLVPVLGEAGLQSQGAAAPAPLPAAPSPYAGSPPQTVGPTAPAPVPNGIEALTALVAELVREVRASRAAPSPALTNDNSVMVAMIEANAKVSAAKAEADGRAAAAQADAQARAAENNMKLVLTLIGHRNEAAAAPAAAPADSTKVALDLLGTMHTMMKGFQPPAAAAPPAPTWQEHLTAFKALRELSGGGAPPSEFQPLVDLLGPVLAAEAAKTSGPREPSRPERAPRGRLEYVRDVGMVEVVAPERRPEAPRRNLLDEVAEFARHDPEVRARLLRALQEPTAPPVSAASAPRPEAPPMAPAPTPMPVEPPPRGPVPSAAEPEASCQPNPPPHDEQPRGDSPEVAVIAVADPSPTGASPVEPPAEVVAFEPHGAPGASPATPSRTPVERVAPPEAPPVSSLAAAPPEPATQPIETVAHATASPSPAPTPPTSVATAPVAPPFVFEPADRKRAEYELIRIKELGREARVAALRRIPGVGAMAEDVARAMESIPREAMATMLPHLQPDTLQVLAGHGSGAGG